jgi:hypothetical protein
VKYTMESSVVVHASTDKRRDALTSLGRLHVEGIACKSGKNRVRGRPCQRRSTPNDGYRGMAALAWC